MKKNDTIKPLIFAVLFLLSGVTEEGVTVSAAEIKQTVSYIYHRHAGSSETEGGCYREPAYHRHTGDEMTGGSCYETPVYHCHVGDETGGGNCYGTVCYHMHIGDGTAEEGCYRATYHTHGEGCYRKVAYDEVGCHVVDYWDTDEDDYEGHDYMWYQMSCGELLHGTSAWHQHDELNCNREGEVNGYILGCGKTETDIDGYALSCEKTEETIDSYRLSCNKTGETIDGYRLSCGKSEDNPCGKIIVSRQLTEENKVIVSAEAEDLTGGELQFSETSFVWYDGKGAVIGTGNRITVSENGTYTVKAEVINDDISKESLRATVTVDEIRNAGTFENSGTHEEENTAAETDKTNPEVSPVIIPAVLATPAPTPTVTPMPTVTSMPTPIVNKDPGRRKQVVTESEVEISVNESEIPLQTESVESSELQISSPTPEWKRETQTVKAEEKKSNIPVIAEPEEIKREGLLQSPGAKMIMITGGALLTFTGIFLLFYLLRQSVSVYNDDGQGNLVYLGRVMVQLTDAGYLVIISGQMEEHAYTNRYCIKPGLFRIGKDGDEELLIEKQDKRISVPLEKEMTVVI